MGPVRKMVSGKNVARGTFLIVLYVVWAMVVGSAWQQEVAVWTDTEAPLELAEASSNTTQIHVFLQESLDGVYKWNIESGYYDPIAPGRGNDMSIFVSLLKDAINYTGQVALIPENTTRHSTAMLVLRSQIHALVKGYCDNSQGTYTIRSAYWWSTPTHHLQQVWTCGGWLFNIGIFFVVDISAGRMNDFIERKRYEANKARISETKPEESDEEE